MIPYGRQSISEDDAMAVAAAAKSDWLTSGPTTKLFENRLGSITGSTALAVSSGTAAIHTAYAALNVGSGDRVLCTPMTFIATLAPALQRGAIVDFVDVDPQTGLVTPEILAERLDESIACVAVVDYAGHPVDAPALSELCGRFGAWLLEDAAHSLGSTLHGRPVGSMADVTTFSFFPTKNITSGEGGAVGTNNPNLARAAGRFRDHGLARDKARDESEPWFIPAQSLGLNYRLSDILSSLGLSQLGGLSDFKTRRLRIKQRYDDGLSDVAEVATPLTAVGAEPFWHLYPLRVLDGRRHALWQHLQSHGVAAQVNFVPAYRHPAVARYLTSPVETPGAELFYSQQLSLPLFVDLGDRDVDRVISLVRSFFGASA